MFNTSVRAGRRWQSGCGQPDSTRPPRPGLGGCIQAGYAGRRRTSRPARCHGSPVERRQLVHCPFGLEPCGPGNLLDHFFHPNLCVSPGTKAPAPSAPAACGREIPDGADRVGLAGSSPPGDRLPATGGSAIQHVHRLERLTNRLAPRCPIWQKQSTDREELGIQNSAGNTLSPEL